MLETIVCATAQHRQILDQVLWAFEITPDYDLDLMRPGEKSDRPDLASARGTRVCAHRREAVPGHIAGDMRRAYLLIHRLRRRARGRSLARKADPRTARQDRAPEAVRAGTVKLVGTNRDAIISEATRLLDDPAEYERMARLHNPYGDGKASDRIASRIVSYLHPA